MNGIYKMNCSVGRMGDLEGVFIAKKEHVKFLIDKELPIYFGEVLGKHSDIVCTVKDRELTLITDDPTVIEMFTQHQLYSGYDPFDYPIAHWDMDLDNSDGEFDDMTIGEYIKKNSK
jgi:hypothetical protein